jgi:hypothetical protein
MGVRRTTNGCVGPVVPVAVPVSDGYKLHVQPPSVKI